MWVDTSTLVGKHLTVRGFFVGEYDYRDKVVPVIREAAPLVAEGALVVPVAGVYPLADIQDAVQHLLRGGKILLKVAYHSHAACRLCVSCWCATVRNWHYMR